LTTPELLANALLKNRMLPKKAEKPVVTNASEKKKGPVN